MTPKNSDKPTRCVHGVWIADHCFKCERSIDVAKEAREWLGREGFTPVDRMISQHKRSGTVCLDGASKSMVDILAEFYRYMTGERSR